MVSFSPSKWSGNNWPSIDIEPVDGALLFPLLMYLSAAYGFPMPSVADLVEGYAADFTVLEAEATLLLDTWTFSLACSSELVRDDVLARLQALPANSFTV